MEVIHMTDYCRPAFMINVIFPLCSTQTMPRPTKVDVMNLRDFITRNFVIYMGHLVLLLLGYRL
jgi:hypothetical protein